VRGLARVVNTATRPSEWRPCIRLAEQFAPLSAAIGMHPWFADGWTAQEGESLRDLASSCRTVVAIGEIGLDFWDGRENADLQFQAFEAQLALARELDLPVVLHNRKSWNDCFQTLRRMGLPARGGFCHGFTGSREVARQALDVGLYLSFGGSVTYPDHARCRTAAAYCPADRLLTESDAPDQPVRTRRNRLGMPVHVGEVHQALAEIRCVPAESLRQTIAGNVRQLFG
jgi:TatD DNase family protein